MAANRTLNTNFWNDHYISSSLTPQQRYLYLYLKLNPYIQTSGCCELKELTIQLETGLPLDIIREGIKKLAEGGKIRYEGGWLAVAGEMQNKGAKLKAATEQQLAQAPDWVGEFLVGGKDQDDRVHHPAIQVIRDLTERYPAKSQWDVIIELLGSDFDEDYLRECHAEWARRGYNPRGESWYTDWYVNRSKPGTRISYGKRTDADKLADYYKEFNS